MKSQIIHNELEKLQVIERMKHAEVTKPWEIKIGFYKDTRSNEQNRKMWAMLHDISKQVFWGGEKLKPEEWKDVFSANLKQQKAVEGLDGGIVYLGAHTSKMNLSDMSDMIEIMHMFGANNEIKWTEE